jgi:hypothetical protein
LASSARASLRTSSASGAPRGNASDRIWRTDRGGEVAVGHVDLGLVVEVLGLGERDEQILADQLGGVGVGRIGEPGR